MSTHRTRRIPRVVFAIASLLAALVVSVGASTPAQAWQSTAPIGRPGTFYVPTIVGSNNQTSCYPYNGVCYPVYTPWLQAAPIDVTRSPATTGQQTVIITTYVQRWDGSQWVNQTQVTTTGTIPAGYSSTRLSPVVIKALPNKGGYFQVSMIVQWASGSAALGTVAVAYNGYDYQCRNIIGTCQAGPGWIYLRS